MATKPINYEKNYKTMLETEEKSMVFPAIGLGVGSAVGAVGALTAFDIIEFSKYNNYIMAATIAVGILLTLICFALLLYNAFKNNDFKNKRLDIIEQYMEKKTSDDEKKEKPKKPVKKNVNNNLKDKKNKKEINKN